MADRDVGRHPTPPRALQHRIGLVVRDLFRSQPLFTKCFAEFVGTFFIVLFGCGSVHSALFLDALKGLWQVASVWGFGVSLAIYSTATISGAHLNPAVSVAFAVFRPDVLPLRDLLPYVLAQNLGGVVAGGINYAIYQNWIRRFEDMNNIVRGERESVVSASAYGEYFPNPGLFQHPGNDEEFINSGEAFLVEAFATGVLMFMILALTDPRNKAVTPGMIPFFIGFTVAVLISLYAPLTQGGYNPARDFAPRLVALMAGWKDVAIPGPRSGFWVYVFGPIVGALVGALLFSVLLEPGLPDLQQEEMASADPTDKAIVLKCTSATCNQFKDELLRGGAGHLLEENEGGRSQGGTAV